jgi:riboflavin transporter FmnP
MARSKRGQTVSVARRITLTAVFAALAFSVIFIFRFKVSFLTFDLKDAIITLSGLLLGPATAFFVSLLVALLEFFGVDNVTGPYGLLMNFASSAVFSVICSTVYRYRKTLSGAILGLIMSIFSMVLVMMPLNLLIVPLYSPSTSADVAGMIPTLLLPFNLIKGTVNAALVLILYKPVRRALHAARLLPHAYTTDEEVGKGKRAWVSIAVSIVGILVLAAALAVFVLVLRGHIVFG